MHFSCRIICTIQKKVVPLHRQTKKGTDNPTSSTTNTYPMNKTTFNSAMRALSKDCGTTNFNIDLNSYESDNLIPKIGGGWLESVYVNDSNVSIAILEKGYTFAYLSDDLDEEELEQVFEEVYYHFMNEEESDSVEEYLSNCITE